MNNIRKWVQFHKVRAAVIAVSAAAAVAAVFLWVVPAYAAYVRQDHIDTCYGAMYSFGLWYHLEEQDLIRSGMSKDDIAYDNIARDIVRRHFGVELDADLSSGQICRAGGTWTIVIDPDTHRVMIQCSAPEHIWYVDSVDDNMLETFRDMQY